MEVHIVQFSGTFARLILLVIVIHVLNWGLLVPYVPSSYGVLICSSVFLRWDEIYFFIYFFS